MKSYISGHRHYGLDYVLLVRTWPIIKWGDLKISSITRIPL